MPFDAAPFAPKKFIDVMRRRMAYLDDVRRNAFWRDASTRHPAMQWTVPQRACARCFATADRTH